MADGTKNNTTKTLSLGVRFPHEVVARLDAATVRHSVDGPTWTRSDAILVAVKQWLAADELAAGIVATPTASEGMSKPKPPKLDGMSAAGAAKVRAAKAAKRDKTKAKGGE